jgi:hypothetical protein
MTSIIPIVLIGLVGVIAGFLAGMAFSGRGAKQENTEVRKPLPAAAEPDPTLVDEVHIWRQPEGAQIVPELDGKRYLASSDLTESQHERLARVVDALRLWLITKIEPISPPPQPILAQAPVNSPPPAETLRKPSANPIEFFARALQSDVPKVAAGPKSIAGQVDEILQEKLVESPLANRAIRLMELPGKGMVVMVGLDHYEGVDAVPDEEVRALIRSAVMEWERRVDTAGS